MCLIVFAWQVIPRLPLVAAANRDEYYARAAAPAAAWPEHPQVYGGRDLQAGGSWMGITRGGQDGSRFAAITNVRSPQDRRSDAPSRGALVADFLAGDMTPQQYVERLAREDIPYNGYNLVLGERDTLIWYSNRGGGDERNGKPLAPGIYGLSNGLLDAPWPKVLKTKAQFASLLCQGAPDAAYFDMLADTTRAPDFRLPDTGVPLDLERVLSAVRIDAPGYGTRSSTVVKLYADAPGELHEILIA